MFALLAGWRATGRALWPAILAVSAIVLAEGAVTVVQVIHAGDPTRFLIGSRLSEPLGYPNATGALFMIVLWLNVGLASRPWLPAPARGLAFGLAGLAGTLNLLTESRGSAYTLPAVVVVYLLLVPNRLRSLAALALVAAGIAPVLAPILRIYNGDPSKFDQTLRHASIWGSSGPSCSPSAGWLYAAVRRSHHRLAAVHAPAKRGIAIIVVADPGWGRCFLRVGGDSPTQPAQHSLAQLQVRGRAGRRDLALRRPRQQPVRLLARRADRVQAPPDPGNRGRQLPRAVPGAAAQPGGAALPAQPRDPAPLADRDHRNRVLPGFPRPGGGRGTFRIPRGADRDLAGILFVGASVWILHGLVDWLWEMPVLGVLGMALFGAACGLVPRSAPAGSRSWLPRAALAAGALVAAAAAVSLAVPWFADRQVQQAIAQWQTDPAQAFSTLESAHSLNPLDDSADVLSGSIASHLHRYDLMRTRFQAAVNRSPDDWYANLELGIAASLTNQHAVAAASLERALHLDPGEEIVQSVVRTFKAGRRIDSDAVDREFAASD